MTELEPYIGTERLKLVALSVDCLGAMLEGDRDLAGRLGGFLVPSGCELPEGAWIRRRLGMISENAGQREWLYRAIVLKKSNEMAGHINFHHMAPDPDLEAYSDNGAELGYTVEERFRRQGYARESVMGMMGWARDRGVRDFFLSISPSNIPSLRLAERLNFRKIDERMDEIDGLEHVFARRFDPEG